MNDPLKCTCAVVEFVAVKASENLKHLQRSTCRLQNVPSKPVADAKYQQV